MIVFFRRSIQHSNADLALANECLVGLFGRLSRNPNAVKMSSLSFVALNFLEGRHSSIKDDL